MLSPTELHRAFIWVVLGAKHSGKKECSSLWLNAMHSGKKVWLREFVPPYIFPLNPDYVAARSLRSLCSKKNCKAKGNNKGKKTMLFVLKHGWVYNKMKRKYRRAVHHMSFKTFQMVQRIILSFSHVTKSLGKFQRRFKWLNCAKVFIHKVKLNRQLFCSWAGNRNNHS